MTTRTAAKTTNCILTALKPDQRPEEWLSQASQLDWTDFAVRAIAFGLAPQLHHRFQAWDCDIPARPRAKLAVTYAAQARRSEAIYEQLAQVLSACSEAELQPICLKGVHLAACYYAEPALRPMNDIDLLFTAGELPRAESLLLNLGYGGKHKSAEHGARVTKHTSTFRREQNGRSNQAPNPYLSATLDRTVEPHSSLEESWFGLTADITPGIRERTETAVLANHDCRVLNPEDLLHHVCLHFCFHLIQGAPALVQLTDVLAIIQTGRADWQTFLRRVDSAKTFSYALAALTLAQNLIGAEVPDEVLAHLKANTPPRLSRRIEAFDIVYVLRRTQQKPLVSLGDRLRRGVRDRAEIARWAPTVTGKLRVWQTAVQFTRTDTMQQLRRN